MSATETTVRTASGEVAGTGDDVRVYRGIPFAAPPVGPLRWRPPQPVEPWTGVHDGSRYGLDPIQIPEALAIRRSLAPGYGEDCLNLNVWAPAQAPAGGAPVIVYFDFGGFVAGSASRERVDGTAYARRGVILVTANYRVGVLGFLAHPALTAESPQHVSGNYGFLDAIAALQWVHDNIAAFGGDPTRVTVTGASAGAGISGLMPVSPLAKGLFHRVLFRSGGAFNPVATLAQAEAQGRALGDNLDALRAIPASEMLAQNKLVDVGRRGLTRQPYLRPIVDNWALPDQGEAYRSGAFAAVPTIVGNTVDEAGGRLTADIPVKTVAELREYFAKSYGPAFDEAWTYYGTPTDAGVAQAIADAWSDDLYHYGVRGLARAISKRQPKTYRYLFAHVGEHTRNPPAHDNDMAYVFGSGDFEARDRAMSDAMLSAYCNFAATGDPNGPGAPPWKPYDATRDNYLTWGEGFPEGTHFRTEHVDFLERLYTARKSEAART
jgi:para-nitrobenzyl esterase